MPIVETSADPAFVGSVDDDAAVTEAAALACECVGFSRDDDDECYVECDEPSCFNCRARRWTQTGFTCTKGLLRG
ncbi:MAG: hypothetical protein HGB10_06665 [Coriobacteriia bacterium]|nr:hypothetical protein [Coriobacteriia bacterium]